MFAGLLIYAACSDVASLTIPNWVSVAMAGLFLPLALLGGLTLGELGVHYLFGFCALAVGFFLFQGGIIGGGDAKLLAAAAVWTGYGAFLPFIVWTALAGGVMALAILTARKWAPIFPASTPEFVNRLLTPASGVPYGVAIMVGGLMAIPNLPLAPESLTLP
ncbi:MAG: prepilin peptidase [Hyphomonadaceae bacterium]